MQATDERLKAFKNKGKDSEELRRRRKEVDVQLRRSRKDDQMFKKRNVNIEEETSPLQESNQSGSMSMAMIVESLKSQEPHVLLQATQAARKILSRERNPPINQFIDAGVVPLFVEFLAHTDNPALQFEAAWALTNIASGNTKQTQAVVNAGAVPFFIKLLSSEHGNVCEQSVWALGNIAGDGPVLRDLIVKQGVLTPLLTLIKPDTPAQFLRNITWTLSNLCRNKNPPPPFEVVKHTLPIFSQLLYHVDKEILSDSCWALSYLTDGTNEKIQVVIESGVVPRLVELISSAELSLITPALRSIGNIVTGNDQQTQCVIDSGALTHLRNLLMHSKANVQKEAAWTISNIAAGNPQQIQTLIDANILEPLITVLEVGEFKVKKEAAWAVANITSGGNLDQINILLQAHVLPPLGEMLKFRDASVLLVVLDTFKNLLKAAETVGEIKKLTLVIEELGVLDTIEELQHHENQDVYKICLEIIERFFPDDDNEDASVAPESDSNGFIFQGTDSPGQGYSF